jgi:hypothetical protein
MTGCCQGFGKKIAAKADPLMSRLFAVIRTRGRKWDDAAPLRERPPWREHAAFIDGLEADGVLRLAGPWKAAATC